RASSAARVVWPWLLDCLPDDFLDGRHSVLHFAQAAAAKRDHAFVDRLAAQLHARRADENQLLELLTDLHHLVEADAPLVAGRVALVAAGAFHRRHGVGV